MNRTNQERLAAYLADPYLADLRKRFEAGRWGIEFAEPDWPQHYYADPYWNISVPLAVRIAVALPTAADFRVGYDRAVDFQHVGFTFDGDTFVVRWYKTFIVHRKSDRKCVDFGRRDYAIADWFAQGKHRTSDQWYDASDSTDPFRAVTDTR